MPNKVNGRNHRWVKEELIGKGDAGEVFRVTSKDVDGLAVLKCPSRVATGGTILRQASQIEQEGRILERLAVDIYEDNQVKLVAPKLLDESPMGTALTGAYFIVSSQARGTSLADMIRDQQRGMQNISQRFMMKLISAMFHLYNEIHARGIVWNDVKPDHLFWDAEQNTLMVIDWANGRILNEDVPQPSKDLAFLEDLKQMLDEFGRILQTVAPDLIMELGWPDQKLVEITPADIEVLHKRCTFLEQYLNYRVVENRALEAMAGDEVSSLEDLALVISSQDKLIKLGEAVDLGKVESLAEGLLFEAIDRGDAVVGEQIVSQIIAHSYEELSAHWQITSQLLKLSDKISQKELAKWVHLSVCAEWVALFWEINKYSTRHGKTIDLEKITNLVRSMVLPGKCRTMAWDRLYQQFRDEINMHRIRQRFSASESVEQVSVKSLYNSDGQLMTEMRSLVRVLDWERALQALDGLITESQKIDLDVDDCLVLWTKSLKQIIREIKSAWSSAGLSQLHNLVHAWLIWDPQAEFLLEMDDCISQLDEWLTVLVEGPGEAEDAMQFISDVLARRPQIEKYMEQTHWLKNLLEGMEKVGAAKTGDEIKSIYQKYRLPMDWLSTVNPNFGNSVDFGKRDKLEPAQSWVLENFHVALKSDEGLDEALREIKFSIPWVYPAYLEIAKIFNNAFLQAEVEIERKHGNRIPESDQANVKKAITVMAAINAWKERVLRGMLSPADDVLTGYTEWKIAQDCIEVQQIWTQFILPYLDDLHQGRWNSPKVELPELEDGNQAPYLRKTLAEMGIAVQVWQEICRRGFDENHLVRLIAHFDAALESYLDFTNNLATSKPNQFIRAQFQTALSEQYRLIKRLRRIASGVQQAQQVISRDEMLNTGVGDRNAEELILGLVNLNREMPVNEQCEKIGQWQAEYQAVVDCADETEFGQKFKDLDMNNPLMRWFLAKWQGFTDRGLVG